MWPRSWCRTSARASPQERTRRGSSPISATSARLRAKSAAPRSPSATPSTVRSPRCSRGPRAPRPSRARRTSSRRACCTSASPRSASMAVRRSRRGASRQAPRGGRLTFTARPSQVPTGTPAPRRSVPASPRSRPSSRAPSMTRKPACGRAKGSRPSQENFRRCAGCASARCLRCRSRRRPHRSPSSCDSSMATRRTRRWRGSPAISLSTRACSACCSRISRPRAPRHGFSLPMRRLLRTMAASPTSWETSRRRSRQRGIRARMAS